MDIVKLNEKIDSTTVVEDLIILSDKVSGKEVMISEKPLKSLLQNPI